ncbi:putative uncharacterized protein DDB_G0272516, partial [Rhagoletis pomonella]|uniref:putative uncharacterized protein DDB_G0272516 n=1 Tax=Rhagoletis pomonella TaxID=28610 RepID=UPI001784366E
MLMDLYPKILLVWIPGRTNIPGNEFADKIAKLATTAPVHTICNLSHKDITKFWKAKLTQKSERNRVEELSDALERSLIIEGMTQSKAHEMAVEQTVNVCRLNTRSDLVKSILSSTTFSDSKDVVAKMIVEQNNQVKERQVYNNNADNSRYSNNGSRHNGNNFNNNSNRSSNNNRNNNSNNNSNRRPNSRISDDFNIPSNGILGKDFLKSNKCVISYASNRISFWVGNEKVAIPILHGTESDTCIIPPRCEVYRIFNFGNSPDPLFVESQEVEH